MTLDCAAELADARAPVDRLEIGVELFLDDLVAGFLVGALSVVVTNEYADVGDGCAL